MSLEQPSFQRSPEALHPTPSSPNFAQPVALDVVASFEPALLTAVPPDPLGFFTRLASGAGALRGGSFAEAIWQALVAGDWALVDQVDVGSSRVLLLGRFRGRRPRGALSPRQRQVLECVERDVRSTAIAAELGVSQATVSESLTGGLRKLGFRSRAELVWQRRDGVALAAPRGLRAALLKTRRAEIALLSFGMPLAGLVEPLPPAERAVLEATAGGLTQREVARVRGTSRHTVGKQLASARRKLDEHTRSMGPSPFEHAPPILRALPAAIARRFTERAQALRLLP
jgi:DNA-binding CsgD family transcriptional regulator